jgi:hypothetical protein
VFCEARNCGHIGGGHVTLQQPLFWAVLLAASPRLDQLIGNPEVSFHSLGTSKEPLAFKHSELWHLCHCKLECDISRLTAPDAFGMD